MKNTEFSDALVKCNGLDRMGFEQWLFLPGMLFNAVEMWWGNGGDRNRPHEGLDLCFFRDSWGKVQSIGPETQIPVMYQGEIVAIHSDFLGQSMYVHHGNLGGEGAYFYTIYGHIRPVKHVHLGKVLDEGDVFATIADTANEQVRAPAHLHISMAWLALSVAPEDLDWSVVTDPELAVLIDPLEVIACSYTVIKST
ncbi:MAG: hypothetical protein JSW38_00560 [Dehalococcoidia bacterium]|nr:MAG: hypothetical protein JSW38_00560 [Dehalococcoidia bacterium]